MSIQRRRPLVSFESSDRAVIVSANSSKASMPRQGNKKRTKNRKPKRNRNKTSQAVRVVKGKVNIKLSGSKTVKVAPSKLITFVPKQQLKQAARNLVHSGPVRRRPRKQNKSKK